ncbi:MAG: hypothetical protein ACI85F_000308 [Bacteroidia bacterium]|jgi:hypothetical protein
MQVLRTLLIIVAVYYAFKFIMRLLAPFIMKKAAEKVNQKMNQQFGGQFQKDQQEQGPEGEVVIKKAPQKQSKSGAANDGDYVDFEEVDE